MFNILQIQNFKSIKDLKLDCKRVNIFIGKPNTGKTNILEALGLMGLNQSPNGLSDLKIFARHETINNLFYDENIEQHITIKFGDYLFSLSYDKQNFSGYIGSGATVIQPFFEFKADYEHITSSTNSQKKTNIKYYRYNEKTKYNLI